MSNQKGIYYGAINPTEHNPIVLDKARTNKGFVLGKAGTGKGFTLKELLADLDLNLDKDEVLNKDEAIILTEGRISGKARLLDAFGKAMREMEEEISREADMECVKKGIEKNLEQQRKEK